MAKCSGGGGGGGTPNILMLWIFSENGSIYSSYNFIQFCINKKYIHFYFRHVPKLSIGFNTLRFDFVNFKFILVSECKLQYLPSYFKFLVYRANKPPLGQLIRSFIVTPPPPVYIKLNPRVRPGPHPTPVFMPLLGEEGVTLSASSMWVLRYPYPLSFIKIL